MALCKCGCAKDIVEKDYFYEKYKKHQRFINHHASKGLHIWAKREHPMKGKHHSVESRAKISNHHADFSGINHPMFGKKSPTLSEKLRGKNNPLYGKIGKANPFYNKKHRKETKEIMSLLNKNENNPMWKGGISYEKYPQEFNKELKFQIRERDNFICQLCGRTEEEEKYEQHRNLAINHIDYNKKNCNPNNLITLCNSCNAKVNTCRNFWTKFFQEILLNDKIILRG